MSTEILDVANLTIDIDGSHAVKPAIPPYPSQYVSEIWLADGTTLRLRPIRPEDEPLIVKFHSTLSEQSVYRRYFAPLNLENRTRHERLKRICAVDYDREIALIAERHRPEESPDIVGVGRLIKYGDSEAELAVVVSDALQRHGIGSSLTSRLIDFARDEHLSKITASVLFENWPMRQLLEKHGFVFEDEVGTGVLKGRLRL